MRLVAIGFGGDFTVYVDIPREEAMRRYDEENPDYTIKEQNLTVKEIEVKNGKFKVYDIEEA